MDITDLLGLSGNAEASTNYKLKEFLKAQNAVNNQGASVPPVVDQRPKIEGPIQNKINKKSKEKIVAPIPEQPSVPEQPSTPPKLSVDNQKATGYSDQIAMLNSALKENNFNTDRGTSFENTFTPNLRSSADFKEALARVNFANVPTSHFMRLTASDLNKERQQLEDEQNNIRVNPWKQVDWQSLSNMMTPHTGKQYNIGQPRTIDSIGVEKRKVIDQLAKHRQNMTEDEMKYFLEQFVPMQISGQVGLKQAPPPQRPLGSDKGMDAAKFDKFAGDMDKMAKIHRDVAEYRDLYDGLVPDNGILLLDSAEKRKLDSARNNIIKSIAELHNVKTLRKFDLPIIAQSLPNASSMAGEEHNRAIKFGSDFLAKGWNTIGPGPGKKADMTNLNRLVDNIQRQYEDEHQSLLDNPALKENERQMIQKRAERVSGGYIRPTKETTGSGVMGSHLSKLK